MNRSRLVVMVGLPGSGKSTHARELVRAGDGRTKRVNRDLLRKMLDLGRFTSENEKYVFSLEKQITMDLLMKGHDVVVDDTNLDPDLQETWREIARATGAGFRIIDFTDVPLKVCMRRNRKRKGDARVPDEAIMRMHNKWLAVDVAAS